MEGSALLQSLSLWQMGFIAAAALIGSVMAGLSGMGGGLLLAVAVSPVVGIHALVPVMTVTMLINHVARVGAFRGDVHWPTSLKIMSGALPLAVLGANVYASLPPRVVAVVIGVVVLIFVPLRRVLGDTAWRLGTPGLVSVGGAFGFISGATIGAGMLLIPVLLGTGLGGAALVGTDAVVGLALLVVKAITFGSLAVLDMEMVLVGVVIGVFTLPGVYLARWIIRHTSMRLHTLLIEVILMVGGASFVWRGLYSV